MVVKASPAVFLSAMCASAALAQEASPIEAKTPEVEATHFEIIGLAPEDLLNLRANASATGMLIGRLPNGTLVKNLGCSEINKTRWCKVADMDDEKVQGWAAARYLQPTEIEATGEMSGEAGSDDVAPNSVESVEPPVE